jgi:hypothetical protein
MFKFLGGAVAALIALVLLVPFKDGDTPSNAARNEIVAQVPYALDILSARHPIQVGLLRSQLNTNGEVDAFVEAFIRTSMNQGKPLNIVDSYIAYYAVLFNKDRVRVDMANEFEKQLGLS